MHLLVPFASDRSEACQHVLRDLALPNLERLLAVLAPAGRDDGDAGSFSPPHERALAAAWGWHGEDGLLPFAAHAAAADGIATDAQAWALLTPSHWQLGRDDVTMIDPDLLALAEPESRALFTSAGELLASEGFAVAWGAVDRWYAARDDLASLATASLDRVIGRNVDRWLRASAAGGGASPAIAPLVRRLQSEAQLVFYGHPVNEAREERGALPVNSFWVSGCGRRQPADAAAHARDRERPACAAARCRLGGVGGGLALPRRRPDRARARPGPHRRLGDADALRRAQRGSLRAAAPLAVATPARQRRRRPRRPRRAVSLPP